MLVKAWGEQQSIGWDQILKGRLSNSWGKAPIMFYMDNPDTRECKHFSAQVWMVKTIGSLLDLTLGLWKDMCGTLHGATEVRRKRIQKKDNQASGE